MKHSVFSESFQNWVVAVAGVPASLYMYNLTKSVPDSLFILPLTGEFALSFSKYQRVAFSAWKMLVIVITVYDQLVKYMHHLGPNSGTDSIRKYMRMPEW